MATWEELCPEGMWPGHRGVAFPRVGGACTEGGNNAKRGGAVPRRDGDMSTTGGSFPVREGLCQEGTWPSTLKACPHPQGGAWRGNTQVPSPRISRP